MDENLKPCWTCSRNPYEHQGEEIAREHTTTKILEMYCSIYPCKKVKTLGAE